MKIDIYETGEERNRVVVIDDALPNPQDIIDLAATRRFAPVTTSSYPGVRCPLTPQSAAERTYVEAIRALTAPIMKDVFGDAAFRIGAAELSLMTQRAFEAHPMTRIPHYDEVSQTNYAVLHFLAPVTQGGTAFYRHRRTGFERITAQRKDAFFAGLRDDFSAYGEPAPRYMSGSTTAFEQTGFFEGHFNRILIYSGALLHSAQVPDTFTYSANPSEGRLTANLFLVTGPAGRMV